MNVSGAEMAAAVSRAGGLGCIGGFGYTPKMLRAELTELKSKLASPDLPFGVDLLLPKVGDGARKTNHDYTNGKLDELLDIIIEFRAKLFISAVGIPPAWVVEKLHKNGIYYAQILGAPVHAKKAIESGCDLLIAQGTAGGGHTGDIATIVLIPQVVDIARGKMSPLTKRQIPVIAAGGIYDGRGLAAALALGAAGVWVGTRFVATVESKAGPRHVNAVLNASSADTIRTTLYTGRPLRVLRTKHNNDWELNRKKEMLELESKGIIAFAADQEKIEKEGNLVEYLPLLMGQAAGGITSVMTSQQVVESMVAEAVVILKQLGPMIKNETTNTNKGKGSGMSVAKM
jgi:NAD(P)H-dependent flavin oxidoreductase YrpB (nitropropane dioxygenase family)